MDKFKEIGLKIFNWSRKHRFLLFPLWLIITFVLIYNLATLLLADTGLAIYFYSKSDFSRAEFQLKNKYILTDRICRSRICKENKVKPALQDLINFYYMQRDYNNIIALYKKHIDNNEINLLPTRIKSDKQKHLHYIALTELAYFYLANKQYNETKNTLDKVFNLIRTHPDFKELEFLPYAILSNYYIDTGELHNAINAANKTVFIYKKKIHKIY